MMICGKHNVNLSKSGVCVFCAEDSHEANSVTFSPKLKDSIGLLTPTGVKHDQGKPDMSLLSNIALLKISEVMSKGKIKYSAHNWRGGFVWSRPLAAAARHLFAFIGGEDKDPETGLSHLAHCACCLMFLLEFEDTKKELDDRFKQPKEDNK